MLAHGRCIHCDKLFPASKKSGTSHIGKHLVVCEEKAKMDGMVAKIQTDTAIDPEWKFDQGRARRALAKLIVLHELPSNFFEYPSFRLLHVRCAAHVLNLVVQDGLDAMASVVDRIRDSVQYVRSSQGRMEKFNAMIARVGLACKNHPSPDVPTRWYSTYLMLESSLPFRAAFEALKETDKDYKFAPSASEWEMADAICHLLGAFYTATKKISGRTYPTSHLYFYEVWNVKQIMEKEVTSENPTIVAMVKEMEEKWMKYFEESFLTSCLPVIFDPRYKYEYVHFQLTAAFGGGAGKYLTKVNSAMKILFAEYASEYENTSGEGDEVAEEDGEGTLDDWDKHLRLKRSHNSNELQRYLEEDLFPHRQKLDILKWWEIHSPKYPLLAAIARDILAVSVSTVPAEAAFSNAGRIITAQRSSLTPSTVETLMCLEDWFRAADRQKAEPTVGDHGGTTPIHTMPAVRFM
uniref:AC transposase n=1 Tax=Triticum urartu TaxID=4572 RepID=A0A8R7TP51_TRIUA